MSHHNRRFTMPVGMFVLVGVLGACDGGLEEPLSHERSTASLKQTGGSAMVVYSPRQHVDESSLLTLGAPESLGGQVLKGSPVLAARIDFDKEGRTAGIFKATTGKVRISFPFTEHATILEGEVTLTDEASQTTHTFKKGDSYFVRKGQTLLWEVKGKHVIKSFFHIKD